MRRDMDLCRMILFYIEENYSAGSRLINISLNGYTNSEIYEHCKLLYEAGLIQEFNDISTTMGERQCMVGNLSNKGYDLLDSIRQDTIWNKTKSTIKEKGLPLVLDTIKTVAVTLISAATEGVANSIIKNGGQV